MKTNFLILFFLISLCSYSQTEREDLYTKGETFYNSNNFKEAALYLFAYREINLTYLQNNDITKLSKIDEALKYSKSKLVSLGNLKLDKIFKKESGTFGIHCKESLENFISINGKNFSLKGIEIKENTLSQSVEGN